MVSFSTRDLYGGAIRCKVPAEWTDMCDLRQVPDHQECWYEPDKRILLVFEIVEYEEDINDDDSTEHYFWDLASTNHSDLKQAVFETVEMEESVEEGVYESLVESAQVRRGYGYQRVVMGTYPSFYGELERHDSVWTHVELCVIRLPDVSTDILITMSEPSSENPMDADALKSSAGLFNTVISSFSILDWTLFEKST
jgi:Ran-interacting Mog1 protein